MTDVVVARTFGLRYGTLATILLALLTATVPACWAAANLYGVDRASASAALWMTFAVIYLAILTLPWLNLVGQEHFARAQRLERMCVSWLYLDMGIRLVWDLPWVLFFKYIMTRKKQVWAYLWWSYMDGGDMRYAIRDVHLLVIEIGISIIGIIGAYVLWNYNRSRRFTDAELMTVMALMVGDFCATYIYFTTEALAGLHSVGGFGDLIAKFVSANIFWIVMPWVVFVWAGRQLSRREAAKMREVT